MRNDIRIFEVVSTYTTFGSSLKLYEQIDKFKNIVLKTPLLS